MVGPVQWTPLVAAPRLARRIGACNLYIKNDAVCMPTLSFNAGKLMLVYYDLRQDHTLGVFTLTPDLAGYIETRKLLGEPAKSGGGTKMGKIRSPEWDQWTLDGNLVRVAYTDKTGPICVVRVSRAA